MSKKEAMHDPTWRIPFPPMGMTLRDWFAGQALVGLYAEDAGAYTFTQVAKAAYATADAMLAEREDS